MTREDAFQRRTVLKMTGVAGASAILAGCGGPETDNETGGDGNETTGVGDNETIGDNETAANETTGDNETATNETANETATNETANETTGGNESAAAAWEDVDTIALDGYTQAWEGVEPAPIEGEENPTLQLQAGETYTVEWTNADGQPHDFVIYDENDQELESTEQVAEQGQSATLEFEATEEMAQYICTIHPTTMVGDVEVS